MEPTNSVTSILRSQQGDKQLPKTYFDLVEKVGTKGQYQKCVFFIFALNWFITGLIVFQPVFLFLDKPFECRGNGLLTNDCDATVCSLGTIQQWESYQQKNSKVNSLSTEFGPYLCQEHYQATLFKMVEYVGIFMGYIVFLYFTDNYGRKMSIVMTWTVTTVGITILCSSVHISMAVIGLFLAGAGCESAIRISMAVLGQIVDYNVRQQYSVALEIAFGIGGLLIGFAYWLIPSWRLINIVFILIPCIIEEILFIFYFEETPKFLLGKGLKKTLQSMNRIGYINKGIKNILTQEDIQNVMQENVEQKEFNKKITPIDIFRFPSLRLKSICNCLIFAFITWLYFGPIFIVDRLGFTPYLSHIILTISEIVAYPIAYVIVENMPRKKTGIISFAIAGFFNGILVFVQKPDDCDGCFESYLQLFCIFASRFFTSFYFSLFFLYVTELYPLRARGIGFGIGSAAGAIASSSGGLILTSLANNSINPMIFFTLCAILAIATLFFLPQTQNKPLQDEIEEIQNEKNKLKQSRYQTFVKSKQV